MEKRKDSDEIRFTGAIGADHDVDWFNFQLINGSDTFEAANRDVVKRVRGHPV
jgi:hypothetical protein